MLKTILETQRALQTRELSAVMLAEQVLAAADDPQGQGSLVFTAIDHERTLLQAAASDQLRASGHARSPLEGIPVSIKDLFDVAGEVTTAGSFCLRDAPPAVASAEIVQRLRNAGAVIVGRTNMTEFAYSALGLNPHYGTPRNPWDRATGRVPGGSSSGAAISVTDDMAVAAIGTDTGGSVRIPSALCGLTGFKPTARRIPLQGTLPLSPSMDSIGPMARSVRCCEVLDAVLSATPYQPQQPYNLKHAHFATVDDITLAQADAHVRATYLQALGRLQQAGATIEPIALPEFGMLEAIHRRGTLVQAEAWHWHRDLLARAAGQYDQRVSVRIALGEQILAADYIELRNQRANWQRSVAQRLAGYQGLLLPTVPVVAPEIAPVLEDDARYYAINSLLMSNTNYINFLDGCALTLPCHAAGQAPVGLMLAAPAGADARILALGLAVEHALVN